MIQPQPRRATIIERLPFSTVALAGAVWLLGLMCVTLAGIPADDEDLLLLAVGVLGVPAIALSLIERRTRAAVAQASNGHAAYRPRRPPRIYLVPPCCHCGRNPRAPRRPARIVTRQRWSDTNVPTRYRRPARIVSLH